MRTIQHCGAWLLLSSICLATDVAHRSDIHGADCACNPEIHRSVESALLGLGWASQEMPAFGLVRCFAPVSMSETLTVNRVRKDPVLHTIELRLRCIPKEACLPFLVSVPDDKPPQPLRGEDIVRQKQQSSAYSLAIPKALHQNSDRPAALVVPGQVVTLVWESTTVHLTRKVICLDRGAVGEQVRTRPIGVGHVVRAWVVNAGRVKAVL